VADHHTVWEWLSLVAAVCLASIQSRHALVAENLLLRQQLAVALRARPRPGSARAPAPPARPAVLDAGETPVRRLA